MLKIHNRVKLIGISLVLLFAFSACSAGKRGCDCPSFGSLEQNEINLKTTQFYQDQLPSIPYF